MLEVVVGPDQFTFKKREQLGITRRIVWPEIIGFMNDAATQKPRPDAVGDVAGEPGILRRDQPVGERLPRIAVCQQLRPCSVGQDGRLHQLVRVPRPIMKYNFKVCQPA